MLTSADRDAMRADLLQLRDERPVEIAIRRGATTLEAQTVRVERTRPGSTRSGDQAREQRGDVVVLGGIDLDIEVNDRFTDNGILYEVIFVRPNKEFAVMAEATAVE
jgi:hypothetical protein